jgi:predicted negative regulator of RcsB-dependent stress response
MIYTRTTDTSFKAHFKSNVNYSIRAFKKETITLKLIVILLSFALPFAWTWYALKRSRNKEGVLVPKA